MLEAAMPGAARRRVSVFRFQHALERRIATLSDLGKLCTGRLPLSCQRCHWLKDGVRKSAELIGWRVCRGSLARRFGRSALTLCESLERYPRAVQRTE
jgi:hypothetical protein